MALTSAQQVRLKIQDAPIRANDVYYGDGQATVFNLPHRTIAGATAYTLVGGAWVATGATFASGQVLFSGVISANSGFNVRYEYSTFSDDEVDHFISAGGCIVGAAKEAVEALMFDGLRRASWGAPDGTSYDDSKSIGLLSQIHKTLSDELEEEATLSAGMASWSETQANY